MKRLLALFLLLPVAFHAAVPQFTENIACGPVRIRLPKGVEATPMPALESYRFIRQRPDGSATEFDAFAPEQLWRRAQRLGAWADKDGNRYELVMPKTRLGGPYPQTVVTQEEYDRVQAKTGALTPAGLGMWLGEWAQAACGKPQPLRPVGAVRAAQFATVGNAAALVFFLKASPRQPFVLLVSPAQEPPERWRAAFGRALAGFAASGTGLSGMAKEAGGWITIDRPPYRVHTDLPKRDRKWLDTLLEDMLAIRRAYAQAFPEPKGSAAPTSVIRVFADPEEYLAYAGEGQEWSGGFFSSIHRELVVKGDAEAEADERRATIRSTTFHEGFHQYLFLITPSLAQVPIWFNEGHATFFETFRVRGGHAMPGPSRRRDVAREARGLRSADGLARLLAMSQEEFYAEGIGQHYAVAWALVSWLRTEAPDDLKALLPRYYALLCARKTQLEANAEVFPPETLARIAEGLERYLR